MLHCIGYVLGYRFSRRGNVVSHKGDLIAKITHTRSQDSGQFPLRHR